MQKLLGIADDFVPMTALCHETNTDYQHLRRLLLRGLVRGRQTGQGRWLVSKHSLFDYFARKQTDQRRCVSSKRAISAGSESAVEE